EPHSAAPSRPVSTLEFYHAPHRVPARASYASEASRFVGGARRGVPYNGSGRLRGLHTAGPAVTRRRGPPGGGPPESHLGQEAFHPGSRRRSVHSPHASRT